jgi:hypothetical protein
MGRFFLLNCTDNTSCNEKSNYYIFNTSFILVWKS